MTHLLQDEFRDVKDMRGLYDKLGMIPTSENADIVLIRSHVAYVAGQTEAARCTIKPSRGHSYRIGSFGQDYIVRIADHYDYRTGVIGYE